MGFGCAETPPAARFQCGVCCCLMYWRAMASGAPPQLAAKSDGDHSAPFRSRFWMSDHPSSGGSGRYHPSGALPITLLDVGPPLAQQATGHAFSDC